MSRERRQNRQDVVVRRDLPLLSTDRIEADGALSVDDEQCRSLTQTHQRADHVVRIEHNMVHVRQEGEGVVVALHELGHAGGRVWRDGHDSSADAGESFDVVSQLREMPPAERSAKPSEKDEHDRSRAQRLGQLELVVVLISEREVRSLLAQCGSTTVNRHRSYHRASSTSVSVLRSRYRARQS